MLSKFIQQLRIKNNLTQEFLASKISVSRPTYSQIERGERDLTITEAKKLAEIFGIAFNDFLIGKENLLPKIKLEKKVKQIKLKKQKQEIRISVPQEKVEKFKEVLLYILERIGARPNIGEAVVCKLMYFIDFDFYEKFDKSAFLSGRYFF